MSAKTALLPLHSGEAPKWLMERMIKLGRAICEGIIIFYGRDELLRRLGDPFWFQALGCVLGYDWHSSGLTTTVCGALKAGLNPIMHETGFFICGGKGKTSLKTPEEIDFISDRFGLDGDYFIRMSRLSAKVDSACLQDGFELYHHTFIFTEDGKWAVIQPGMCPEIRLARRYHWLSTELESMVEEPHSAICCDIKRNPLNLVAQESRKVRENIVALKAEGKEVMKELKGKTLIMPPSHWIDNKPLYLKKIDESIRMVEEGNPQSFEDLLLIKGMGKESIRALSLVSELLFGTPPSFKDPVRYSFAHGGKDGHPYPVRRDLYDRTISFMEEIIRKAKINPLEKDRAFKGLSIFCKA